MQLQHFYFGADRQSWQKADRHVYQCMFAYCWADICKNSNLALYTAIKLQRELLLFQSVIWMLFLIADSERAKQLLFF